MIPNFQIHYLKPIYMPVVENLEHIFFRDLCFKIIGPWSSPEILLKPCKHIILLHKKPPQNFVSENNFLHYFSQSHALTVLSDWRDAVLWRLPGGRENGQYGHTHAWQWVLAPGWELSWLTTKALTRGPSLDLDFLWHGCWFQDGAFQKQECPETARRSREAAGGYSQVQLSVPPVIACRSKWSKCSQRPKAAEK